MGRSAEAIGGGAPGGWRRAVADRGLPAHPGDQRRGIAREVGPQGAYLDAAPLVGSRNGDGGGETHPQILLRRRKLKVGLILKVSGASPQRREYLIGLAPRGFNRSEIEKK
jgi:hypothetical protein